MMHPRICFVIKKIELRRKESDVARKTNDVARMDQLYTERVESLERKMRVIQEKQ